MKLLDAVEKYIEYRDKKAELKTKYEADVEDLDKKMAKIEAALLEAFDKTGMDSAKTKSGTAYIAVRTSASVADKEAFMEYVKAKEEWPLLEVRASKTGVEQFKSIHEDLPPGVNWREERVINIRRS
jgi:hypothetical protein